jgi:outer membrane lipoprotein
MKYSRFFIALAFFLYSGCAAHVISEESLRLVDQSLSFAQLKENPDRFVGRFALLGGAIVSVSNTKQMGQLEVVQFPLDRDNMPVESYRSGGRFLAQADGFLDPFVFKPAQLVTIVGEVKGHKTMQLDQVEYGYPIVAIREIHLWRPATVRPYAYPNYPYYDDYMWRPYRPWPPWW